jgi:GalNAc-alpha-(1->4)-GalNAc-alpha-(1->3)-diNAcBac-PP-undecaprenol alpha-1,4-N-acetyl-D-galactosaminyltransferase
MRLTLIIASLGCGGAERVMATIANYWAEKGWCVTLLTLEGTGVGDFYVIHPMVQRRPLGIAGASSGPIRGILNNMTRALVLRRAIHESRPDAVISFMDSTNVLVLLSCLGLRLPVIVSERCDPAQNRPGMIWEGLRHMLYPLAYCLIAQTGSILMYFGRGIRRRARVIPNPVVQPYGPVGRGGTERVGRVLITAGRLVPQKGFDLLIHAFGSIAPRHPEWTLEIWGDGPMRRTLEGLRDRLGLGDRVRLPGVTRSLAAEFAHSDLYVLSSRFEGFPNVLCEAMAHGLPAVSFDCPTGPREIIRDGSDGLLVPPGDVPALAASLSRLMGAEDERRRLASRAPEVAERFALEKVMGQWEEVVLGAAGRESGPEATP